jgi:hypothetical protein
MGLVLPKLAAYPAFYLEIGRSFHAMDIGVGRDLRRVVSGRFV